MAGLHPWMYTILFGLLSILIIGNNVWHLIQSKRNNEATSFTVFIGAFFGVVSCLAAPAQFLKWLAFIPILVDPGTICVIYAIFKNRKRRQ